MGIPGDAGKTENCFFQITMLAIVLAHTGVDEIFECHWPLWKAVSDEIIVITPDGVKLPIPPGHEHHEVGKNCRLGPSSIRRMLFALLLFLNSDHDGLALYEYDSVSFVPRIAPEKCLQGIVFASGDSKFVAPRYPMAPWVMNRWAANRLWKTSKKFPDLHEKYAQDRWIAAMAHIGGVPIVPVPGQGYSRNTIEIEHMPHAIRAISLGGTAFHGIKSKEVFYAIRDEIIRHENKQTTQAL